MCLEEKEGRLPYLRGKKERARRDALILADDIHQHPNGELACRVELMGLLSVACAGNNAASQKLVRQLVPLPELLSKEQTA